jgi:mRNA-degrading endonuclease RelE of RelBE toxin-antitoxin system
LTNARRSDAERSDAQHGDAQHGDAQRGRSQRRDVVHSPIHIHPAARQALLDLDKPARRRLQHAIDGLADLAQPTGAVPLTGQPGVLRLRVGGHQVVYAVRDHGGHGDHRGDGRRDHGDHRGHEVLILVIDTAAPAAPGTA